MPFITAGAPTLDDTVATAVALDALGVAAIELGFPFSDPIADGPVIAASMDRALRAGATVSGVLGAVRSLRPRVQCALIAMVSASIVERHGGSDFVAQCAAAGLDGLIVPDLDAIDADRYAAACDEHGMALALLVAPTSSEPRVAELTRHCRGFVYALARAGLTGESSSMPDVQGTVARIRKHTTLPIAVGFGISTPEHVRHVVRDADAAIVGSALVRVMDGEPCTAHARAADFIRPMMEACRSARA